MTRAKVWMDMTVSSSRDVHFPNASQLEHSDWLE